MFDGTTFRLSLGAANTKVDSSHSIHLKDCQVFHPSINHKMFYDRHEYAADYEQFLKRVSRSSEKYRIEVVKGWLEESLTAELWERLQLKNIAIANFDCDLYEFTRPSLDFITLVSDQELFFCSMIGT